MARLDEQDFDEKRLARRQKRQRSQLLAFILLAVIIIVIAAGIIFGVHFIRGFLTSNMSQEPIEYGTTEKVEETTGIRRR